MFTDFINLFHFFFTSSVQRNGHFTVPFSTSVFVVNYIYIYVTQLLGLFSLYLVCAEEFPNEVKKLSCKT